MFDKDINPACAICAFGTDYFGNVLCRKKGPVPFNYKCRRFRYDPLRRKPALPVKLKIPPEEAYKL